MNGNTLPGQISMGVSEHSMTAMTHSVPPIQGLPAPEVRSPMSSTKIFKRSRRCFLGTREIGRTGGKICGRGVLDDGGF